MIFFFIIVVIIIISIFIAIIGYERFNDTIYFFPEKSEYPIRKYQTNVVNGGSYVVDSNTPHCLIVSGESGYVNSVFTNSSFKFKMVEPFYIRRISDMELNGTYIRPFTQNDVNIMNRTFVYKPMTKNKKAGMERFIEQCSEKLQEEGIRPSGRLIEATSISENNSRYDHFRVSRTVERCIVVVFVYKRTGKFNVIPRISSTSIDGDKNNDFGAYAFSINEKTEIEFSEIILGTENGNEAPFLYREFSCC